MTSFVDRDPGEHVSHIAVDCGPRLTCRDERAERLADLAFGRVLDREARDVRQCGFLGFLDVAEQRAGRCGRERHARAAETG